MALYRPPLTVTRFQRRIKQQDKFKDEGTEMRKRKEELVKMNENKKKSNSQRPKCKNRENNDASFVFLLSLIFPMEKAEIQAT